MMTALLGLIVWLAAIAAGVGAWWYFDLGHAPVETLPHLSGRTMPQVVDELGEPDWKDAYTMDKIAAAPDEMRGPLLNTYPPGATNLAAVEIREWHWDRRRYFITVWFHRVRGRWVVLDTCRWQRGIAF